jgi:hypothetical protein
MQARRQQAPRMAPVSYMVVEQWTVVQSRDATAALCVLYVGQGTKANARQGWVKIIWTHPEPLPVPDGRT